MTRSGYIDAVFAEAHALAQQQLRSCDDVWEILSELVIGLFEDARRLQEALRPLSLLPDSMTDPCELLNMETLDLLFRSALDRSAPR